MVRCIIVACLFTVSMGCGSAGPLIPWGLKGAPDHLLTPLTPDHDGDGIDNRFDRCVDLPEDRDGYRDDDGCPDGDNDGDGIADEKDGEED